MKFALDSFFGTEFLFLALYFLKIALLSANQNEEIFSCILLSLIINGLKYVIN